MTLGPASCGAGTTTPACQFGLAALQRGAISAEQFVELNERIGGYDVAGSVVAQRSVADPLALRRAHSPGSSTPAAAGWATVPIVDLRQYTDLVDDIHTRFWSFGDARAPRSRRTGTPTTR